MHFLRISNTQFEIETEKNLSTSLEESFNLHPLFLQLQFLSYLYSDKHDIALTTDLPEPDYISRLKSIGITPPNGRLFSDRSLPNWPIDCWAHTSSLAKWAKEHYAPYDPPLQSIVRKVNSKEFSFEKSKRLPDSFIFSKTEDVKKWLKEVSGKKVLKSVYGLSGRGHVFIDSDILSIKSESFLEKQWKLGYKIIGEPWVERVFDFSTQWEITSDEINYLGSTICHNNPSGMYIKTTVYSDDSIGNKYNLYLSEHKKDVFEILEMMRQMNFRGNVGIDAMIYIKNGIKNLHSIVEINARKTMGYVALMLKKKYFDSSSIEMSYNSNNRNENLLPNFILDKQKKIVNFDKILSLKILP